MPDEILETPAETPAPEIPAPARPAPVPSGEAPPAADLVNNGTVKSERELALESKLEAENRRALEAERRAAELERDNQTLREVPVTKVKRKPHWSDPAWSDDNE